jgi:hypothetical protein
MSNSEKEKLEGILTSLQMYAQHAAMYPVYYLEGKGLDCPETLKDSCKESFNELQGLIQDLGNVIYNR